MAILTMHEVEKIMRLLIKAVTVRQKEESDKLIDEVRVILIGLTVK